MITRLVLVGAGSLARAVLRAIEGDADFQLAGVAAPVGAEELAAPFSALARKDYRALLEEVGRERPLVVSAAPTDVQADVAVAAAEFGHQMLCCAPPAISAEEGDIISRCIEYGGGLLRAEAIELFQRDLAYAAAWAEKFAPVERVILRCQEEPPQAAWRWDSDRCGGGVLMQLGAAGLQFGMLLLRARIVAVEASIEGTEGPFGLLDTRAQVRAHAEDGSVLEMEVAWGTPAQRGWKLELHGEGGSYFGGVSREPTGEAIKAWLKGRPLPVRRPPSPFRLLDIVEAAYAAAARGERCRLPFRGRAERAADYWLGPAKL